MCSSHKAVPYSLAQTMGRPQASIAELLFVCEDIIVPGVHPRACLSVTGATDRNELTEIDGLLCHATYATRRLLFYLTGNQKEASREGTEQMR